MNTIDENIIRKKSSFLRDSSYRIFHVTKESKEDNANPNNNINETLENKSQKKSLKIPNRNGLKQFLFLHKTSCELSSIEVKTPPSSSHETNGLPPSIICHDTTSEKLLKKNKQNVRRESVHAEKLEPRNTKQILIKTRPEIRTSSHRRRKRFIVACSTVLVALTIIITIIIYVIIMTVRHKTQMNQSNFNDPSFFH